MIMVMINLTTISIKPLTSILLNLHDNISIYQEILGMFTNNSGLST